MDVPPHSCSALAFSHSLKQEHGLAASYDDHGFAYHICFKHCKAESYKEITDVFKCRCWCEASASCSDRTASLARVQASPVTGTSQGGAAGLLASMSHLRPHGEGALLGAPFGPK